MAVKLEEFRNLVREEFGEGLRHATPANVREFADEFECQPLGPISSRITIDEPCNSYEEVVKDFFFRILELQPEEAVVSLWTLALDLSFASIESQYAEKLAPLFQDCE